MKRVFLDSCVILSKLPREIAYWLSDQQQLQLTTSTSIEQECKHVAKRKGIETDIAGAFISLKLRAQSVEAASANNLWLPDENDIHVLAGAIASESDIILTENLRDFPYAALRDHGVKAISPDTYYLNEFLTDKELQRKYLSDFSFDKKQFKKSKLYRTAKILDHAGH